MRLKYIGSLHNHTQYSNLRLRDCIIKENDLIDYAIELGHEVVAITDHESVSNAIKVEKYYNKIKEKNPNFKVILGNEIYLCRNGLNKDNFVSGEDKYYHFILLAKDAIGHQQIREISTRAWKRSYMARGMRRVPTYYQDLVDIVGANKGHVIFSTACLGGLVGTQLLNYEKIQDKELYESICNWIKHIQSICGEENFFLELQPSETHEQTYVNRELITLSKALKVPYIITTDSHYLKKEEASIHKAFLNSQDGDREVDSFYATTYMMSTEELESHMDLTEEELQCAYQNILKIKNMCEDYSLQKSLRIPQLPWKPIPQQDINQEEWIKKIPYLKEFWSSSYYGDQYLANALVYGISQDPYLQSERAYEEINKNLESTWISSITNNAHWSTYFLNLQKIVEECWNAGTLVGPSRGSGGGFILLYILGITQINPLRENTQLFYWRFLNPERVSLVDVDVDIEGSRRADVLNHFRKIYGKNRVSNVATFGTEKSKSAILTAARGLGIDVDIAQYLASFIPADRGQLRSLKEVFYGSEEKGFQPIKQFVIEMTENYPELWKIAQKIEGLVSKMGIHAGGVIFVDEDFTNSTALMRAPDDTIITQFDLHDSEAVSLIKMDLLSIEALDKIHNCLDLLTDYGYIDNNISLRDKYEKTIGLYNIERNDINMWQLIWEHKVNALFQMEQQSGIQGIAIAKPKSVDELAVLNSVIRLMAPEKGAEMPLETWAKYRKNINLWLEEMREYGLTEDEVDWLSHHSAITDGICESQEGMMSLVREERLGGNSLTFADAVRKSVAKKVGALFTQCETELFENAEKKGCSTKLVHYVWDVLLKVQRGYSFY